MKINEFFKKTFTKNFIEEADAQYELTKQGAIMTDKKMNKDEAEKAADEFMATLLCYCETEETDTHVKVYTKQYNGILLRSFPFEPPHPEYIIGDTYKFWNSPGNAIVAKLEKLVDNNFGYRYSAQGAGTYHNIEPYTLIDPAEHARLKKENAALKEVLAKQHIFVKNK